MKRQINVSRSGKAHRVASHKRESRPDRNGNPLNTNLVWWQSTSFACKGRGRVDGDFRRRDNFSGASRKQAADVEKATQ